MGRPVHSRYRDRCSLSPVVGASIVPELGVVTDAQARAGSQSGGRGVDRAGPLQSGETISGRIGGFNGDGHIDGTIVAVGVMPLDSPVFPGQPYALSRNFETDIAHEGTVMGSPLRVHEAYQRRKR